MSSKKWVALLNNAAVLVCQRCRFLNAVEMLYRPMRRVPIANAQPTREVARLDTMEPRLLMSSTVTDYALVGQDRVTIGFQTQVSGGLIGSDQQTTLNTQVQTDGIRSGGAVSLGYQAQVDGDIVSGDAVNANTQVNIFGDVDAGWNVSLGFQASVSGDLTTSGTLNSNQATIGGTVTENGTPEAYIPVNLPAAASFTTTPANDQNFSFAQSGSLGAGSYGDLNLNGQNTVTLTAGTYAFDRINIGFDSELILDVSAGDIEIFVQNEANINGSFESSVIGGDASDVYLEAHGGFTLQYDSDWLGTVYVPGNANLTLNGQNDVSGALYTGGNLTVQGSSNVNLVVADRLSGDTGGGTDVTGPTLSALLTVDTGISGTDGVTSSPTLMGSAVDAGGVASLALALAGSNGGVAAGPADVTGSLVSNGAFMLDRAAIESAIGAPLTDGDYVATFTATDNAGNATTQDVAFTLDTAVTAAVTITTPTAGQVTNTNVSVTGTVDDPADVAELAVQVDGGPFMIAAIDGAGQFSYDTLLGLDGSADGAHVVGVRITDLAGNVSAIAERAFFLDTQISVPTLIVTDAATGQPVATGDAITGNTLTFSGVADPGDTVTLRDDTLGIVGSVVADATGSWALVSTTLAEGSYSFSATAEDAAGNTSAASSAVVLTLDATPPMLMLDQLAAGTLTNANLTLTGVVTDPSASGLTVSVDGGAPVSVSIAADNTFSFTTNFALDGSADGVHALVFVAADAAGNASEPATLAFTLDTVALAPAITAITQDTGESDSDFITSDTNLLISGTAEPGANVRIMEGALGLLGTATADADGAWSIDPTLTTLPEGPLSLTATQTDAAGNGSLSSAPLSVTIDTTAPVIDPSGPNQGEVVNTSPVVTGVVFDVNAVSFFEVSVDGGAFAPAALDISGAFAIDTAFELDGTADGEHSVSLRATDIAGNVSALATVGFVLDTQISTPVIAGFTPDTGVSDTDGITNANRLVFTGTADPDSIVTLNEATLGVVGSAAADSDGAWTIDATDIELADGTYSFTATAEDGAGNVSASSAPIQVEVDTGIPTLEIAVPADGMRINSNITVAGQSDAVVSLEVSVDGAEFTGVPLAGDGSFSLITSFALDGSADGAHTFELRGFDAAGNVSAFVERTVTLDTQIVTPTITGFIPDTGASDTDGITNANRLVFAGTAEPGAAVTLNEASLGVIGSAAADSNGNWTIDATSIELADGSYSFTAIAEDLAGNVSGVSEAFSVSVLAQGPELSGLRLSPATDTGVLGDGVTEADSIVLFGQSSPGAIVRLGENGPQAVAADDGMFSIAGISVDLGLNTLSVTASDASGGQASASIDIVRLTGGIEIAGNSEVLEGAPYSLSYEIPGLVPDFWRISWGDGQVIEEPGTSIGATHTYGTDAADPYEVEVFAVFGSVVVSSDAFPVIVTDNRSLLEVGGSDIALISRDYTLSLINEGINFSGTDRWVIDWGDGVVEEREAAEVVAFHRFESLGVHDIVVSYRDGQGQSIVESIAVTVVPTVTASVATQSVVAYQDFDIAVSSPLGEPDEWIVDSGFGDPVVFDGALSSLTLQYPNVENTFFLSIEARYADGRVALSDVILMQVEAVETSLVLTQPVASDNEALTRIAGALEQFDFEIFTPGLAESSIQNLEVQWGDGTSDLYGPDSTASHRYAAGTYTIEVSAEDEFGNAVSETFEIVVGEAGAVGGEVISAPSVVDELSAFTISTVNVVGPDEQLRVLDDLGNAFVADSTTGEIGIVLSGQEGELARYTPYVYSADGSVEAGDVVEVVVRPLAPLVTPPNQSGSLSVGVTNRSEVATGIRLEWRPVGASSFETIEIPAEAVSVGVEFETLLPGIQPSTEYEVNVYAFSSVAESDAVTLNLTTEANVDPLVFVTDLLAVQTADGQFEITWNGNDERAWGYIIEQSVDGGAFEYLMTVNRFEGADNRFTLSAVDGSSNHTVRVTAFSGWGVEATSQSSAVVELFAAVPVPAPTGIAVVETGETSVSVSWDPYTSVADRLVLEVSEDGALDRFETLIELPSDATQYTATGRSPGAAYRIRAVSGQDLSAASSSVSVATEGQLISSRTNGLSVIWLDTTGQALLRWQVPEGDFAGASVLLERQFEGEAWVAVSGITDGDLLNGTFVDTPSSSADPSPTRIRYRVSVVPPVGSEPTSPQALDALTIESEYLEPLVGLAVSAPLATASITSGASLQTSGGVAFSASTQPFAFSLASTSLSPTETREFRVAANTGLQGDGYSYRIGNQIFGDSIFSPRISLPVGERVEVELFYDGVDPPSFFNRPNIFLSPADGFFGDTSFWRVGGPNAADIFSVAPNTQGVDGQGSFSEEIFDQILRNQAQGRFAYIEVFGADLDIDSDNNNGDALPDRSDQEDDIEGTQEGAKIVSLVTPDAEISEFTPLQLTFASAFNADYSVNFDFDDTQYILRSPSGAVVTSGVSYTPDELGLVPGEVDTLYVGALTPNAAPTPIEFSVTVVDFDRTDLYRDVVWVSGAAFDVGADSNLNEGLEFAFDTRERAAEQAVEDRTAYAVPVVRFSGDADRNGVPDDLLGQTAPGQRFTPVAFSIPEGFGETGLQATINFDSSLFRVWSNPTGGDIVGQIESGVPVTQIGSALREGEDFVVYVESLADSGVVSQSSLEIVLENTNGELGRDSVLLSAVDLGELTLTDAEDPTNQIAGDGARFLAVPFDPVNLIGQNPVVVLDGLSLDSPLLTAPIYQLRQVLGDGRSIIVEEGVLQPGEATSIALNSPYFTNALTRNYEVWVGVDLDRDGQLDDGPDAIVEKFAVLLNRQAAGLQVVDFPDNVTLSETEAGQNGLAFFATGFAEGLGIAAYDNTIGILASLNEIRVSAGEWLGWFVATTVGGIDPSQVERPELLEFIDQVRPLLDVAWRFVDSSLDELGLLVENIRLRDFEAAGLQVSGATEELVDFFAEVFAVAADEFSELDDRARGQAYGQIVVEVLAILIPGGQIGRLASLGKARALTTLAQSATPGGFASRVFGRLAGVTTNLSQAVGRWGPNRSIQTAIAIRAVARETGQLIDKASELRLLRSVANDVVRRHLVNGVVTDAGKREFADFLEFYNEGKIDVAFDVVNDRIDFNQFATYGEELNALTALPNSRLATGSNLSQLLGLNNNHTPPYGALRSYFGVSDNSSTRRALPNFAIPEAQHQQFHADLRALINDRFPMLNPPLSSETVAQLDRAREAGLDADLYIQLVEEALEGVGLPLHAEVAREYWRQVSVGEITFP